MGTNDCVHISIDALVPNRASNSTDNVVSNRVSLSPPLANHRSATVKGNDDKPIRISITGSILLSGGTALFVADNTQLPATSGQVNTMLATSTIAKKKKHGSTIHKSIAQKSPRPTDLTVYRDKEKVWGDKELAWQNPIRGENGVGRVIFDPDTKSEQRYIFCINHGWLTIGESPHSTSECKAYKKSMMMNEPYISHNPEVRSFLKPTLSSEIKSKGKFHGESIKAPLRWKTKDAKVDMPDEKVLAVVDISKVNGAKAKVGFGKYKNLTYNTVVNIPGYIAWLVGDLSKDLNAYGTHAAVFYRWLKHHRLVIETNGHPHEDGFAKSTSKAPRRGKKKSTESSDLESEDEGTQKKAKKKEVSVKKGGLTSKKKIVDNSEFTSKVVSFSLRENDMETDVDSTYENTTKDGDVNPTIDAKRCGKKSNAMKKSSAGSARKTVSSTLEEEKAWNCEDEDDEDIDDDQGTKSDLSREGTILPAADEKRRSSRSLRNISYTDIDDDAIEAALVQEQIETSTQKQGKKRKMV